MPDELKPCPFCGEQAPPMVPLNHKTECYFALHSIRLNGPGLPSLRDMHAAWQIRATETALRQRLAEAVGHIRALDTAIGGIEIHGIAQKGDDRAKRIVTAKKHAQDFLARVERKVKP
jgi:hypothetical protein